MPADFRDAKELAGRALHETGLKLKVMTGAEVFSLRRSQMALLDKSPVTANDSFVAPSATVIGEVQVWDNASVWYGAVVRGDHSSVRVGAFTNVMDRCVLTTVSSLPSGFPPVLEIGHYTSIGAGSVIVSSTIGNMVEVGDGCVISSGCVVSDNAVLTDGSVLPSGTFIPKGEKWGGNPLVFLGKCDEHDAEHTKAKAMAMAELAADHLDEYLPFGNAHKHLEHIVENAKVEATKPAAAKVAAKH